MYLFLYFIIKKNQDKTSLKFVIDIKKKQANATISQKNQLMKNRFFTERDVYTSKGR